MNRSYSKIRHIQECNQIMEKRKLMTEDIFTGFIGKLAKFAKSSIGKSEDDIIKAFKTTEVALAKDIDNIVSNALKSKNLQDIETLEAKLLHIFDPTGVNSEMAKQETIKFLNGYSKTKGKTGWGMVRRETIASNTVNDMFKGKRISNRSWTPEHIDFSKFSNQMSFDDLNKSIATAIKTNNWNLIPRAGFEKLGITNMREYFKNNISKINEIDPVTGRWSVVFN